MNAHRATKERIIMAKISVTLLAGSLIFAAPAQADPASAKRT